MVKKPTGSWVAMPTPFKANGSIDYSGFEILIERQIRYGTSQLFILGSAGEVTLLSIEEKKSIVKEVIKMTKNKIPVYFNASAASTNQSVEFAKFLEHEGADGVIFTVPPYLLIPQTAVYEHLNTCMSSIKIPCGIYNNPSRVGVNIEPKTIAKLAANNSNFIVDKEAMPKVSQLVNVKRLCGNQVNLLCCDYTDYSIVIPTLAVGGHGTANIGGNIIPEEVATFSRPWDSVEKMKDCRNLYFKYYPLIESLYQLTNPIVIKAALKILGLPGGHLRKPYLEFTGQKYRDLEKLMNDLGVIDRYGVR
ncbi:dihydrodipicolinate synthase family protein [Vallitalea guaymasensis]|uniref:Dihydrodipicolinate synthase family protein n=1 Tax=Vallitalea guaymasensis TaxID=1185412 RepID=A0A8J8MA88_9FIRM|nr:dihydrodipicolinate synthase family protein [Vallitalea guaymasensis]QUH29234.1 dihydrodipicolinate synthase family protein [Vallitalea guaymasensis]